MTNSKSLSHFFDAMDRLLVQQSSVVLSITLALEDQEDMEPMTLEFEILPPTLDPTDKPNPKKKRLKH